MTGVVTGDSKFACAKWIVDTNGLDAGATHTTIASALTDAVSGETIFIKPGTYTENLTLKAGVNLAAFVGDGDSPTVTIVGKATATFAGTCTISGIRLQTNSDFFLVVSGSSATTVNIEECYLNASNNTGISYTSSSSSSFLRTNNCRGNIGTTGISLFSSSSSGKIEIRRSTISNSGATTTASTISAGTLNFHYSTLFFPITTSSTAAIEFLFSSIFTNAQNVTCFTQGGSGSRKVVHCSFFSGSATAVTISSVLEMYGCQIDSSNAAVISGAGTLEFSGLFFGAGDNITTTTLTSKTIRNTLSRSTRQPAFLAYNSANDTNQTGDGTNVTVDFDTEVFDQHSDFSADTFTAPYTGRYQLSTVVTTGSIGAGHTTGEHKIVTSNRTYGGFVCSPAACRTVGNNLSHSSTALADMDIADTSTVTCKYSNSTKTITIIGGSEINTYFSGVLIC